MRVSGVGADGVSVEGLRPIGRRSIRIDERVAGTERVSGTELPTHLPAYYPASILPVGATSESKELSMASRA